MKEKLSFSLFYVGLLAALIAMLLTAGAFRTGIANQAVQDLKQQGAIVASAYGFIDSVADLEKLATPSLRITLISPTGDVLFESDAKDKTLDLHLSRAEVRAALQNGEGSSYRLSQTLETGVYYTPGFCPTAMSCAFPFGKALPFLSFPTSIPNWRFSWLRYFCFPCSLPIFFPIVLWNRFAVWRKIRIRSSFRKGICFIGNSLRLRGSSSGKGTIRCGKCRARNLKGTVFAR